MATPAAWVERRWWTLERFGLTPAKLPRRLTNRREPRVFCTTFPKAGTHLVERALCLHPRLYRAVVPTIHGGNVAERGGLAALLERLRPGQVLMTHLQFQERWAAAVERLGVAGVLVVRDPRDVVVSEVHYVLRDPGHPHHDVYAGLADLGEQIRVAVRGVEGRFHPVGRRLGAFTGWLDTPLLVLRFEDLVGPAGGGDEERQRAALRDLYAHVGLDVDAAWIDRLQERVFSDRSPTFRRGAIGGWREVFDAETAAVFDAEAGDLLARLGYGPTGPLGDPPDRSPPH